jgi:hypothetical protein
LRTLGIEAMWMAMSHVSSVRPYSDSISRRICLNSLSSGCLCWIYIWYLLQCLAELAPQRPDFGLSLSQIQARSTEPMFERVHIVQSNLKLTRSAIFDNHRRR